MSGDPYTYPHSPVLRNKLGIIDAAELDRAERRLAAQRIVEGIPTGDFDLNHLKAIHQHLFQDVYDWAGEIRFVELNKSGQQFQFCRFIETGMADVRQRLSGAKFLRGRGRVEFSDAAARIMGDVNYVHPFREGNGRAQLFYLGQLAEQAGHPLDLTRIVPARWTEASRRSHEGDYAAMAEDIGRACED